MKNYRLEKNIKKKECDRYRTAKMRVVLTSILLCLMLILSSACGAESEDNMISVAEGSAENISDESTENQFQEKQPEVLYAEILDLFYNNISSGWEEYRYKDSVTEGDVSYLFPRYNSAPSYVDKIGYAFIDLDSNGIPELLIGMDDASGTGNSSEANTIYDLYTYADEDIKHLASSGERSHYYLCGDNTIINYASGGAASANYLHYCMNDSGDDLAVLEYVYSEPDDDWENTYWYHEKAGSKTEISEEKAYEIIGNWPEKVGFEFKMFSEYTPQSGFNAGDDNGSPENDEISFASAAPVVGSWQNVTSENDGAASYRITWNEVDGADGYEVEYGYFDTDKIADETQNAYYKVSFQDCTVLHLRVRAYKTVNGERIYTDWSDRASESVLP